MKTTMDRAGRLVVPKPLRERVGLEAGEVTITVSGSGLLIEPTPRADVHEVDGLLVVMPTGALLNDDDVRNLRLADQR